MRRFRGRRSRRASECPAHDEAVAPPARGHRGFEAARAWYEEQREGLGAELLVEVARVIERAGALPRQFPLVEAPAFRRGLVRKFPYAVFFMETDAEVIVLAVLHQAMHPSRWKERAR